MENLAEAIPVQPGGEGDRVGGVGKSAAPRGAMQTGLDALHLATPCHFWQVSSCDWFSGTTTCWHFGSGAVQIADIFLHCDRGKQAQNERHGVEAFLTVGKRRIP